MIRATTIAPQTGTTELGLLIKSPAMTTPKTALTINKTKKITIIKIVRARCPTTSPVNAPIDFAWLRTLAQTAPKSWIPAKKMVPRTTHKKAGNQPQITAMAGPTIGAAPATEVKWCRQSTYLFVGTKSTPSSNSCAGVGRESSSWRSEERRVGQG